MAWLNLVSTGPQVSDHEVESAINDAMVGLVHHSAA
jgi:hypothetical protein